VSAPEPFPTALTAPASPGLRGAREALAFYARHPEALPRPNPLHRALWGAATTALAARLVVTDRRLRRAALLPSLLTLLGCMVLAAWSTLHAEPDEQQAATFNAFLVSFVALSSMPPTVLQRLWIRLANEARRAVGLPPGEDPFPGEPFLHLLWREGWKAARQAAVVSLGLLPLLAVVHLLPGGRQEAATIAGVWAFYWIVIDAFELPMEVVPGPRHGGPAPWYVRWHQRVGDWSRWLKPARLAGRLLARLTQPWNEEVAFTERHAPETLGFGLVVGALLAIPVAGLFFRSVAIVGATALLGRLEPAGHLPRMALARSPRDEVAPPPLPDGPPPLD
jgi:hypothetical protein